jgi:primosomal protein N' (replication factor Y) (superfamily II helicase)
MTFYFSVVLPLPLEQKFTYKSEEDLSLGSLVQVRFSNRLMYGVLWEKTIPFEKALSIQNVFEDIVFSQEFRHFIQKMAAYTLTPLGKILKLILPNAPTQAACKQSIYEGVFTLKSATKHQRSQKILSTDSALSLQEWKKISGYPLKTLKEWVQSDLLIPYQTDSADSCSQKSPHSFQTLEKILLSPDQEHVITDFERYRTQNKERAFLLQGVTGSGKTEVALKMAEIIWKKDQQVLILVPEIVLRNQWISRISKYFDISIGVWHSGSAQKNQVFYDIVKEKNPVIIGARSALFLPYPNLGLIIIDEEHENAYRQEDHVLYHGRDMAVLRAHCQKIPIVLLSATPCLETLLNVQQGQYQRSSLSKRHQNAAMPTVSLIDLRGQKPEGWISKTLQSAVEATLQRSEQSLIFLNRRGYASLLICYRCSYRASCPHCSVWLAVHDYKKSGRLMCHYCGYTEEMPQCCPVCQAEQISTFGIGVEQLYEELQQKFPTARLGILSSDSSSAQMFETLQQMKQREIDILLGTQMIAKGHHFPLLTCVGVVDADFALSDLDLRSEERMHQLLLQVMGRAGREAHKGHMYIQTFQPEHEFFKRFQHSEAFFEYESKKRKENQFPPFFKLAGLIISSPQSQEVQQAAMILQKHKLKHPDVLVLGPAPAALSPLKAQYRWRFLLKTSKEKAYFLQPFIQQWLKRCPPFSKNIRITIDIDPYFFL